MSLKDYCIFSFLALIMVTVPVLGLDSSDYGVKINDEYYWKCKSLSNQCYLGFRVESGIIGISTVDYGVDEFMKDGEILTINITGFEVSGLPKIKISPNYRSLEVQYFIIPLDGIEETSNPDRSFDSKGVLTKKKIYYNNQIAFLERIDAKDERYQTIFLALSIASVGIISITGTILLRRRSTK